MGVRAPEPTIVSGLHFDDLTVGQRFDDAPAVTLTPGHSALHQAILGDRFRLALDQGLSEAVTGKPGILAHPNLVCDMAIGQSTLATGRVMANLFYRGLVLHRAPVIGDTLHTSTTVVALKQNRSRHNGAATGLAVLQIVSRDQHDRGVLNFERCAMLPIRTEVAGGSHADAVDGEQAKRSVAELAQATIGWNLAPLRQAYGGEHFADLEPGRSYVVEAGDVVSAAPELVRLSLNLAAAHTDLRSTGTGRRLVYGGHTIGLAASHLTRALPNVVYIVAWLGCDHLAPVFEDDTLATTVAVEACEPLSPEGGLVTLQLLVHAHRVGGETQVLDWRVVALMA
jgi:acyl dehydratase